MRAMKMLKSEKASSSEEISEGAVYFRPGMTPSQRQIYYQVLIFLSLPWCETLYSSVSIKSHYTEIIVSLFSFWLSEKIKCFKVMLYESNIVRNCHWAKVTKVVVSFCEGDVLLQDARCQKSKDWEAAKLRTWTCLVAQLVVTLLPEPKVAVSIPTRNDHLCACN